jgi:RNA polymerase sigma-70 factor (ECF subfamily)
MLEFSSQRSFGEAALAESRESAAADEDFAALVRRQSRFVYRVAFSLLRNTHDAEDVTQESFLKIYRLKVYRNDAWRGIEDERAFLARVAWRIAVERIPKRETGASTEPLPCDLATPEQLAVAADRNASIHRLIDALPEELRQPLVLSAIEELTSAQVAHVLRIPEGTVRRRVMQARKILREKLNAIAARGTHAKHL